MNYKNDYINCVGKNKRECQVGAYPGFSSMKILGQEYFSPPRITAALSLLEPIYTPLGG